MLVPPRFTKGKPEYKSASDLLVFDHTIQNYIAKIYIINCTLNCIHQK